MSTQFDKLKEIFLVAALKETPEERAAFLDGACAGDAMLRRRLEALLDADAVSACWSTDRPSSRLRRRRMSRSPRGRGR